MESTPRIEEEETGLAESMGGPRKRILLPLLSPGLALGLGCLAIGFGPVIAVAQTAPPIPAASSPGQSAELAKVIAQLNTAAAAFRGAQADFTWDVYQAVIQDHDIQSGTIYFQRHGDTTSMALNIQPGGGGGASKIVVFDGKQLSYYQPAIKQMMIFRAGSNRAQYESYLTLGFGGSGSELEANWNVSLLDKETMNGVAVVKLDLVPKAQKVKESFTHVTIWVDPVRGVSLKQVFYEPSGDQRTDTFTNIKYNEPIPGSVFHIKTAPGTSVQTK